MYVHVRIYMYNINILENTREYFLNILGFTGECYIYTCSLLNRMYWRMPVELENNYSSKECI